MLLRLFNKYLVIFCLAAVVSTAARAELVIEITQGAEHATPLAVVPFANRSTQALEDDIHQIIADDLRRSGEFEPLSVARMLSLPSVAEEVYYRDWKLLGQNYVLIGDIQFSELEQSYTVRYELFDVHQQVRVLGEKLSAGPGRLRDLGHHISDAVYETITGTRGIFSTQIAYVTLEVLPTGVSEYRLQLSDADGKRARTLLKSVEPILSLAWSPDASNIAYVSFESGRPRIYIQNIVDGTRKIISDYPGLNGAPSWSPDGKYLAMTLSKDGNAEIYRYEMATKKLERLTNHYRIDTEASWSPKGNTIVFTSDRSGGPQIYWMGVDGQDQQRLTFEGKYNARPRYGEDAKTLFYVHQSDSGFNIAKMDLETGVQTIMTETPLDESPSLSPNGRMLIYGTQRGRKGVLAVVSLDGQTKYFLPSVTGDVREPAWSPFRQ